MRNRSQYVGQLPRAELIRLALLRYWSIPLLARRAGVSCPRIRYVLTEQEGISMSQVRAFAGEAGRRARLQLRKISHETLH